MCCANASLLIKASNVPDVRHNLNGDQSGMIYSSENSTEQYASQTISGLIFLLSQGQSSSAFDILLDIDGSHRCHRRKIQYSDARNIVSELLLRERRTDSDSLDALVAQSPQDVVSVLLACARVNETVVPSQRAQFSFFKFPDFQFRRFAFSSLADQLCGQAFKKELHSLQDIQFDIESPLQLTFSGSPGNVCDGAQPKVCSQQTHHLNSDRELPLDLSEYGKTAVYRLSDWVLEMCVSGTQALKNPHETSFGDICERWFRYQDCGEISSVMNQSMAHGDAYRKLVDVVDKTKVTNGVMAAIVSYITMILHEYVICLNTPTSCVPHNECYATLNKSELWAEGLMHLLKLCEEAVNQSTSSVIDKILARPGRYYDAYAVNEIASTALTMCFHELSRAILRPSLPLADNLSSQTGGKDWFEKIECCDDEKIDINVLSSVLDSSALGAFRRVSYSCALLKFFGEEDETWIHSSDHEIVRKQCKVTSVDEKEDEEVFSNELFQLMTKDACNEPIVSATINENDKDSQIRLNLSRDLNMATSECVVETLRSKSLRASAESHTLSLKRKLAEYEDLDEKFQTRLLHIFVSRLKVYQHLGNLFSFALLGAGDFADALISQLNIASALCEKNEKFLSLRGRGSLTFVSAADPVGKLRRLNIHLQKSLQTALNLSFASDTVEADMELSSDVEHNGSQSLWSVGMHFHYKVNYPLNIVLTNCCVQMYSLLFDFFLKLRRATNGIHSLFILSRRVRLVRLRIHEEAQVRRMKTLLWQFCWEAQSFLYEVREKTMRVVLERFSDWKGDLWDDIDTIWQVKQRLEHLLQWSLDTCFLSSEHQGLLGVLTVGFQIIISVEGNLSKEDLLSRSPDDVEDMLRSASFSLKRRMHFFRDVLDRIGSRI